jgi:ribosomal protein S18 acetylase RimI-like enzyme
MTASLLLHRAPQNGLQALDLSRHLGGMARLIEQCFASTLDASGRGFVREMRALSHLGPLLKVFDVVPFGSYWNKGYVWLDDGQIVGCASAQRAAHSNRWLVANVAVHPDHRRKGIAQALMQATLELVRAQGGAEVMLQVDDDNLGALALYRQLGFAEVTTQTIWRRAATAAVPGESASPFTVRLRRPSEWRVQLTLARQSRPHGLAWNEPLTDEPFRPTLGKWLNDFGEGLIEEHWMAEHVGRFVGSLVLRMGGSGNDRLILLAHPEWAGPVERALLAHGLRRLAHRPWPVNVDYAAEGEGAAVLRSFDFQPGRLLRWMRAEIK